MEKQLIVSTDIFVKMYPVSFGDLLTCYVMIRL